MNLLVSLLTNSVSKLENKVQNPFENTLLILHELQEVTKEKGILEKKLKRYEEIELATKPSQPIQYISVPKKKRTRRPATQVPRSHKCPDVQCQKTYE